MFSYIESDIGVLTINLDFTVSRKTTATTWLTQVKSSRVRFSCLAATTDCTLTLRFSPSALAQLVELLIVQFLTAIARSSDATCKCIARRV